MDNIQKLILGVLGISGMLALLVPSSVDVAPPPADTAVAPAVATQEAVPTEGLLPEEEVTDETDTDEDVFLVGEPAIDGNPLQGSQPNYQAPQQFAAPQYTPQPSGDFSQPTFVPEQSVATPQLPLPVPPPAN